MFFLYLKEPKRTREKKDRKAAYRKKRMAQQLRKEKQAQKEASKFSIPPNKESNKLFVVEV